MVIFFAKHACGLQIGKYFVVRSRGVGSTKLVTEVKSFTYNFVGIT